MLALLRADLQQLLNLRRTREGRSAIVLLLCLEAALGLAGYTLGSGRALHDLRGPDRAFQLAAVLLAPAILIALRTAFAGSARRLLGGPEMPMLLASPAAPAVLAVRALWRGAAGVLLWSGCLGVAGAAAAVDHGLLPAAALARVLPAVIGLALPPLALAHLAFAIGLRWGSGRVARFLFAALGSIASILFFLYMIAAAGSGAGTAARDLGAFAGSPLGRLLLAPGVSFLAGGAFAPPGASLLAAVLWPVGSLALVVCCVLGTGRLLRGAFEGSLVAGTERPRARGSRRPWPEGAFPSLLRKELLSLLQQPGRLIAILFYAAFMLWMAMRPEGFGGFLARGARHSAGDALPLLGQAGSLLGLTALLMGFVLPGFALTVFQGEGRQWSLLAASPADRRSFLLAKAGLTGIQVAPSILVVLIAAVLRAFPARAILVYLALMPPAVLALATPILALGCSPRVLVPAAEGELAPRLRTAAGTFLAYCVLAAVAGLGLIVWWLGAGAARAATASGGEPTVPLLILGGGWWLLADLVVWWAWRRARRNVEHYFAPRE